MFCSAEEITVAVAADLQFVFQDVASRFQKESSHNLKLIFGSSGNFSAHIQNGAPFDLFFSADISYPQISTPLGWQNRELSTNTRPARSF